MRTVRFDVDNIKKKLDVRASESHPSFESSLLIINIFMNSFGCFQRLELVALEGEGRRGVRQVEQ